MQLIDTHCHLDFPDYKDDLAATIKRAEDAGVIRMIVPGTSVKSSRDAIALAGEYPAIFAGVGIHPHEADKAGEKDIVELEGLLASSSKIVAIGEVGLDFYRKYSKPENQQALLKDFLEIAKEKNLPLILHSRNAGKALLEILDKKGLSSRKGVLHCYSEGPDLLKEFLALGLYISFTGNITYEKAKEVKVVIEKVPLERLLLETDSPYITPEPLRGKRNEPANVSYLLETFSSIYKLTIEDIARITTHNANNLFSLGIEEKEEISYAIRDSLYLNITNRCTNECTFCTRQYSDYVKGHNLTLEKEPTIEEIIKSLGDISKYKEIVFCGYGEPTLRLDVVKKVASYIKEKSGNVRLVTNGEGNLINSRSIASELKGLIDRISVSLNAPIKKLYNKLCPSIYGEKAYDSVINFIKECISQGVSVEVTCLDMIGEDAVEECRKIAKNLGASFRLRHLDIVG